MYDIVPGVLQHLREADIVSKAGLAVAAQGQEYCRTGAVRSTYRQGARLNGIVEVGSNSAQEEQAGTDGPKAVESSPAALKRFLVTVEIRDTHAWHFTCTCTPASMVHPSMRLCAHAAALLYCWLARPAAFALSATPPGGMFEMRVDESVGLARPASPRGRTGEPLPHAPAARGSTALTTSPVTVIPHVNTVDSLVLLAVGDLRAIAKEYELAVNGLGKQELIEAIMGAFRQPVAVRRVVSTLEKTQRQFLATFTLAGGFMSDEELRGLFERFGLGRPEHFQQALARLQSKGLVLRTSFNTSQQLRTNPGSLSSLGSLNPLEVTWIVPPEVGAALSITLPVTPFRLEEQREPPIIQHAEPYRLLADLLLVARALEGRAVPREEKRAERRGITGSLMRAAASTSSPPVSPEGSVAIPPPAGLLPADLLETLQDVVPLAPTFLRFAYRILRLGEILYTDAESSPTANTTSSSGFSVVTVMLRILPNAAELLLGPARDDVTVELYAHWLRQATYIELFDLTEAALRLRCRTIAPNQPALRVGELEAENREARQWLISLLAQAPLHQWISFSSFARFLYRLYPTFLQRRQRLFPTPHWWVEQDEGHPLHPTQWSDWSRAEGRYLAQLLQGPLHWWGAGDLAFSSDGQLQAFRLTSLAELLFRGPSAETGSAGAPGRLTTWPGESPAARVSAVFDGASALNAQEGLEEQIASTRAAGRLEPVEVAMYDMSGIELSVGAREVERDGEGLDGRLEVLMVSSPGNWPLIDLVERFTRVKGVQAGRLSYQITPASLSEALRRGEDLATFLELLRSALDAGKNDGPIQEMLGRLERSIANYGRLRLYTGVTLLEVADTLTLRELAATTSIEQQTIRAIHPTMLVLRKQGGEQLIDELKRRGQAPLVHGDE